MSDPFSSEDEADPDDISLADALEQSDVRDNDKVSRVSDTTLTTAVPDDGMRITDTTENDIDDDNNETIPLWGHSSDSDSLSLCPDSPSGSILSSDSSVCNVENSMDSISICDTLSDTDDSEGDELSLYPSSKFTSTHFDALLLGFFNKHGTSHPKKI